MALNLNGRSEERQLFPKLQEIIKMYRSNFSGTPVTPFDDLDCEATDTDGEGEA